MVFQFSLGLVTARLVSGVQRLLEAWDRESLYPHFTGGQQADSNSGLYQGLGCGLVQQGERQTQSLKFVEMVWRTRQRPEE